MKNIGVLKSLLLIFLSFATTTNIVAQNTSGQLNTITTAVTFLLIPTDARACGMGEIGAATPVDANANFWNPAKLAWLEKKNALSFSYTPWLRAIQPDINIFYLAGCMRLKGKTTIGFSTRHYQSGCYKKPNRGLGNTIDLSLAYKINGHFSAAISARYIYSSLFAGIHGKTYAADISAFYTNDQFSLGDKKTTLMYGVHISNIGAKIKSTNQTTSDFIPTNLRLGIGTRIDMSAAHQLGFYIDANKLLVPSPPTYQIDSLGRPILLSNGHYAILAGRDPNRSAASGIFGSFTDAPNGFREELNEIILASGMEYGFNRFLFVRGGFFYEHKTKGFRQFFTSGIGIHYRAFDLNFSYLMPIRNTARSLDKTYRITLHVAFDAMQLKR
ncbi:MAG: type IX secretion system outer membrane channel protein PorV [Bacteroidia bacterium]